MITGRSASAMSLATRARASGSGGPGGVPTVGGPLAARPGPGRRTGRRGCRRSTAPGGRSRPPPARPRPPGRCPPSWPPWPPASVTSATIGTWSTSWREPDPQRAAGARPPMTTIGDPQKKALVMALIPLVTPGPGGQGGDAGPAGDLGPPLGGEPGRLLVAGVDEPDAGRHAAVVEREDVAAGEGEDDVDSGVLQCAAPPGCRRGRSPGVGSPQKTAYPAFLAGYGCGLGRWRLG